MSFFHEFGRKAPNKVFCGIISGGLAGVCYSLLIPVVLSAITDDDPTGQGESAHVVRVFHLDVAHPGFAGLFFTLCGIIFVARLLSRALLMQVSMDVAADLRTKLSGMISRAAIAELEIVGQGRLTAVLTQDVNCIADGAQMVPALLTSLITLIGSLGFLLYLNYQVFVFVVAVIGFGMLSFQLPAYIGSRMFKRARHAFDSLQEALLGVVNGTKELKLDATKQRRFLREVLGESQERLLTGDKRARLVFIAAEVYGDLLGFLTIGSVAFVFENYYSLSTADLIAVVMALLYVSGPVTVILGSLPPLARASASYQNVIRLLGDIREEETGSLRAPAKSWRRMSFRNVEFSHAKNVRHDGFQIGPIDLEIARGKVTMIVGGNGSGKSTLGKLISLLYIPQKGVVNFDDVVVTSENVDTFRQSISAIFTDYYLFDRLLGEPGAQDPALAKNWLERLHLNDKVNLDNGVFSTLKLSDGQRKRLALLVALMDEKSLCLFDEWAADQDPAYKQIFYRELLPELCARGVAVVVISHDDRYFDVADRLYVVENGRISAVRENKQLHIV